MTNWSAAVSTFRDREVMETNLRRSPALCRASHVYLQEGYDSVAAAYNAAIDESKDDVLAFVHPDVYLPEEWDGALQRSLRWLEANDSNWGVLGLVGCESDGRIRGFAFSTGLGGFIGSPFEAPRRVRTVDEFVFMIRRSSGIRFDEMLPGPQSQLCATDACLQAEARGLSVYVVPCFALHNSNRWTSLPHAFWRPYLYMRRKWWNALPIIVPYTRLTKLCLPMIRNSVRYQLGGGRNGYRRSTRVNDVVHYYETLRVHVGAALELRPVRTTAAVSA